MNTAPNGHLLINNGKIVDGSFSCNPDEFPTLNDTILTYKGLIDQEFSGNISLIEFLGLIDNAYGLDHPLLNGVKDCLLTIHRNSITIH